MTSLGLEYKGFHNQRLGFSRRKVVSSELGFSEIDCTMHEVPYLVESSPLRLAIILHNLYVALSMHSFLRRTNLLVVAPQC